MNDAAVTGHEKVYGFLHDFVFKFAFGKPQNTRILTALLNSLMQFDGDRLIDEVTILNPYCLGELQRSKAGVLDVKVRDKLGRYYFIEAQVARRHGFAGRILYYLSRLFAEQLDKGEDYTALQTTTGLTIVDFDLWPAVDSMYNVFRFRNVAADFDFSHLFEVRTIELSKFRERRPGEPRSRFERWLDVLGFGPAYLDGSKRLPDSPETQEEMTMAIEQLKQANADRELRNLLEAEERRDRDIATQLVMARREGIAEGIAKGLAKGEAQCATMIRNLAARGMSREQIAEVAALPPAEVDAILAQR